MNAATVVETAVDAEATAAAIAVGDRRARRAAGTIADRKVQAGITVLKARVRDKDKAKPDPQHRTHPGKEAPVNVNT